MTDDAAAGVALSPEGRSSRQLPGIQILRGLAAVLVVITHSNAMMRYPRYFGSSPFEIRDAGVFGVAVFFVISGFIISIVSLDRQLRPRVSIKQFVGRRFIRIIPFMWMGIIFYDLLTFVGTHRFDFTAMLRTMILWPVGELKPNVLWSLQHELIFYTLFSFAMSNIARRYWILVGWFVAPLIFQAGWVVLGDRAPLIGSRVLSQLTEIAFLGGWSGANVQFGLGLLIGICWLKRKSNAAPFLPYGLGLTVGALLGAVVLVEWTNAPAYSLGRSIGWSLMAAFVVWVSLVSHMRASMLRSVGIELGDASFAIYLTHNGMLLVMMESVRHLKSSLPSGVLFAFFSITAVALGVVVHRLIEAPLISWLSHRAERA